MNIERIDKEILLFKRLIVIWAACTLFFTSSSFAFVLKIPIIISVGILLVVFDIIFNRRVIYGYSLKSLSLLGVFLILYCISLYWSIAPEYGRSKVSVVLGWVLYFMVIAGYVRDNMSLFMKANIILFAIYVLLLIIFFGTPLQLLNKTVTLGQRLGMQYAGMEVGFNPIWLSRYIGFLFLSFMMFNIRWKRPIWTAAFYIVAIMYLIATASKGPIFSIIFSVFFYFYISRRIAVFKWLLVAAVGVFIIVFSLDLGSSKFLEQRFSLEGSSVDSRIEMMDVVISSANNLATSFFGNGTGSTGYLIAGSDIRAYPHNIIVELYGENGLLGILIFFGALAVAWKKVKENPGVYLVPFCFFSYYFVNAQFSGDLMFNQFLFMFYFVIIVDRRFTKITLR